MPANIEFIDTLNQIEKEKGIDKETIFEAIEQSLITACKKHFGTSQNIRVVMDRDTGDIKVFAQKTIVDEPSNDILEISLAAAKEIDINFQVGDLVEIPITPRNFGRISAQTAKQVVVQKFREAERAKVVNEFKEKEHELLTGTITRIERRNVFITVGKTDMMLAPADQIPGEYYNYEQRIRVYVTEVKAGSRSPIINVSRAHPNFVRKLFEQEVPEIRDGLVEIKSIAREAGARTKIAVATHHGNIDPVGACVGANGVRVNIIVDELNGEKVDIVSYNEDVKEYIAQALSPATVLFVSANPEERTARIIVPDNQLSLAIGKEGQNARLAAKLTGFRIDIKSYSKAMDEMYSETEAPPAIAPEEPAPAEVAPETPEVYAEDYDGEYADDYDDEYYDDEYEYDDDDEYEYEYDDEYEDEYEEQAEAGAN